MKKNPWLAAILNFFTLGGGTLYNGRRMAAGAGLLVGGGLLRYGEVSVAPLTTGSTNTLWIILVSGLAIVQIGMAIDAYREAKGDPPSS